MFLVLVGCSYLYIGVLFAEDAAAFFIFVNNVLLNPEGEIKFYLDGYGDWFFTNVK